MGCRIFKTHSANCRLLLGRFGAMGTTFGFFKVVIQISIGNGIMID
jgi:hypothetical protein